MRWLSFASLILIMGLSACAKDRNVTLSKIRNTSNGPDEFSIVPGKPLEMPKEMTTLPAPTPGMTNRAAQQPKADAIAALGGNAATDAAQAIPARDGALVNYASRGGVTPGIRQTLAQEDLQTRRRHGKVNVFNLGYTDDYTNAYRKQWLNADAERDRLRSYGVKTPSAPPG